MLVTQEQLVYLPIVHDGPGAERAEAACVQVQPTQSEGISFLKFCSFILNDLFCVYLFKKIYLLNFYEYLILCL